MNMVNKNKNLIIIVIFFFLTLYSQKNLPRFDFIEYKSAVNLIAQNKNPYLSSNLKAEQKQIRDNLDIRDVAKNVPHIIKMWNPPIIFGLIYWTKDLSYYQALFIWQLISCLVFFFILAIFVKNNFNLKVNIINISSIFSLITFPPFWATFRHAQISFLILISFYYFIYFRDKNKNLLSGFFLSLSLIKPHLLYLIYILALGKDLKDKKFKSSFGLILGVTLLSLFALLIEKNIWSWYFNALKNPPIFKTTTIGSFIGNYFNVSIDFFKLLPSVVLSIFALYLVSSKKEVNSKLLILLVPLSLITSAYGWIFDHLVMLPSLFFVIIFLREKTRASLSLAFLTLINILACWHIFTGTYDDLIWYSCFICFLSIVCFNHRSVKV